MKKIFMIAALMLGFSLGLANGVFAENVYEFDLSKRDESAEKELSALLENIPEEILDELPQGERTDFTEYNANFFADKVRSSIKKALKPSLGTMSLLMGAVILSAIFNIFAKTVTGEGLRDVFSFCATLCIALCIFGAMRSLFSMVEALLRSLSETMLVMIPAMEAIYIRAGNLTGATVSATGVNLMIGFTENLFSKVLEPFLYTAFVLGVTSSVTKNSGIAFMAKTIKGLITGMVIAVMALLSFGMALQTVGASAYDSFGAKALKFAIGNYLPLVGGTLSDSFNLFSGSLGVIKQSCGIIGIAALAVAFLPPALVVIMNRIAIGASGALAEALGCSREGALLSECKGICTLVIAVCAGAVVMYIIALGIFIKTPVAIS